LRFGVLLPCGLVTDNGLLEFGNMMVEKLCEIGDLLRERYRNPFPAVMEYDKCFWFFELFQVKFSEMFELSSKFGLS
jgi:hypothetical protein